MNDDPNPSELWREQRERHTRAQAQQIRDLQTLAIQAVLKPDTLTADEIQQLGWGCVITSRELSEERKRFKRSDRKHAGHRLTIVPT